MGGVPGTAQHFPGSAYYLRYKEGKRLRFECAGVDFSAAVVKQQRKRNLLRAVAEGVAVVPNPTAERVAVKESMTTYLDEVALASLAPITSVRMAGSSTI